MNNLLRIFIATLLLMMNAAHITNITSLPVRNVKELIVLARARTGVNALDFAGAGAGTIPHLAAELFAGAANSMR